MKLLWVKGNAPLSKLIMWGLNEPVSHFALLFDNKIVFHSDLTGAHIQWYKSFQKTHETIFELEYTPGLKKEEEIYQEVIDANDGKGYDYGAFIYFAWRAFLWKFFNQPIPEKNPWGDKDRFLCDEVIQTLPNEICSQEIKQMDLSMKSPYMVWLLINKKTV